MLVIMLWFPGTEVHPAYLLQVEIIAEAHGFRVLPNPAITTGIDKNNVQHCEVVISLTATSGGRVTNIMEPRVIAMLRKVNTEIGVALVRTATIFDQ